ncbi:MAG: hydrolase [Candidatus Eisenbacteria bacterium]
MLSRDTSVLVAVDFQAKLMPAIHDVDGMLRRTMRLIQGARLLGLPILVTEQYPKGIGATHAQIIVALGEHYRPIQKMTMSCMGEPAFSAALAATGRKQVILSGIEAHVCVHQTAADLVRAGYEVHVAADCISSRTARDAELARRRAAQMGCRLTGHEMAIFEILAVAGTPEFKEWIRIVHEVI